jgi:16S rRNA (uracil1498-N3)-methyltransferase
MIRLHVCSDLGAGARIVLEPDPSHYLTRVMRLGPGDELLVFNGRDGEWRATLAAVGKRDCALSVAAPTRAQTVGPDLDLIIALVKRPRLETIIEKAAELGVRRILLTTTTRTNADHAKLGRLQAIATEASEQTGRLDVPEVTGPRRLSDILSQWPAARRLLFCDEAGDAPPATSALAPFALAPSALAAEAPGPWAVLIGPEGGFSPAERAAVRSLAAAVPVSLGPRILRADTAAIAALTLWQSQLGDWRGA